MATTPRHPTMSSTIDDYRRALQETRTKLHVALAGGSETAYGIALLRTIVELMDEELRLRPAEVINFHEHASAREPGSRGPFLWQSASARRAAELLRQYEPTDAEVIAKQNEYTAAVGATLRSLSVKAHTQGDCETRYFIEEHPRVQEARNEFLVAVQEYMAAHRYDPTFYKASAVAGLVAVLEERQDVVVSLRAAQDLGLGKVSSITKLEPALLDELIAFVVSCLPYVGNAMALIEAATGRDLFCRKLSVEERGIIGIAMMLPALGRIARGGFAFYTASRLARLYGRDAQHWAFIVTMGERATADPSVRRAVREAGKLLKAEKPLPTQLAQDVEKALASLVGKGSQPGGSAAAAGRLLGPAASLSRKKLLAALAKLGESRPLLKELDELALKRVVDAAKTERGLAIGQAKGQLLEELKESRTVRLLQDIHGAKALGIAATARRAEYFPGYMITDVHRRKLSDGIVGWRLPSQEIRQQWYGQRTADESARIQGVIEVLAVDETKAGKAVARELSYVYDVTASDRAALRAVAERRLAKAKLAAEKLGQPFEGSLEQFEKEVAKEHKLGELGGQARGTIERLDQLEDGSLPTIFIGDDEYLVWVRSVSKTKIFGVLPKDVPSEGIARRLRDTEKLNFDIIGINISQRELEEMAKEILQTAAGVK